MRVGRRVRASPVIKTFRLKLPRLEDIKYDRRRRTRCCLVFTRRAICFQVAQSAGADAEQLTVGLNDRV